jgi:hypothetical protein
MANRQTKLVIKNNTVPNAPFSGATLLKGEPIVNTADGIMMFSGVTSSTSEWTPAGTGGNATFFEVGSNLYELKIRNRITKYENQSGSGLIGKFLSGTTNGFVLADISSIQGIGTYVTGGTLTSGATNNSNNQTLQLEYNISPSGGPFILVTENTFTTGGTYNSGTTSIDFYKNDGGLPYSVSLSSLTFTDTYVTGFTYNPATNTLSIEQNGGVLPLSESINTVSGLSFSNLTSGRVVYVGSGGLLVDESEFTYEDGTNTLGVGNIEASGDVTIQGSLKVFGPSISAFTSELYVEDPNITLNYNPTGSTTLTSVNSGFAIQDGNGVSNGDVNFDIVRLQNLTGLTSTQVPNISEYTSLTGYSNRGWITQLNDIIIRSTGVTDNGSAGSIKGVRVLTEFDTLDGGSY